jgi:hypothetical protein
MRYEYQVTFKGSKGTVKSGLFYGSRCAIAVKRAVDEFIKRNYRKESDLFILEVNKTGKEDLLCRTRNRQSLSQ